MSDIDPVILPHAIRAEISAMYANAFNSCVDVKAEERIDTAEAWERFGQGTWVEAFGAEFPGGENLSLERAREEVLGDLEYWCEE